MKLTLFITAIALAISMPPAQAADRVPVVVELFTSEGCSSCPPADALLGSLSRMQSPDVEIIALGEHVDYWNELGWKDRFSTHEYTLRQEDYARRFHLDSPYTPQMVIDGTEQLVGNDEREARRIIASASQRQKPVEVDLQLAGDVLKIDAKSNGTAPAVVLLAITEDDLTTEVKAGENGGRRLVHQAVVRSLRQIGMMNGETFTAREPLKFDPSWRHSASKAVVFLQDARSKAIVGGATCRLAR